MNQRHIRETLAALREDGFEIIDWRMTKHVVIRVQKHGHQASLVLSNSPRDRHHVVENTLKVARRMCTA